MTVSQLKNWFTVAFIFLIFIAIEGLIIRHLPFQNFIDNIYYYNILQSHSHTSFLAWVVPALMLFVIHQLKVDIYQIKSSTNIFFFIFYLVAFISGVSFIFSGYSIFSIVALVVFLLVSYVGIIKLFVRLKSNKNSKLSTFTVKTGILFYFLSSLSTWVLPILILTGLKKTPFYYYNVYFYLHFLYNGFITFIILALILFQYTSLQRDIKRNFYRKLMIVFAIGTILTFSGSLLWNKVHIVFNFINFLGAILMLIPLIYFSGVIPMYLRRSEFNEKLLFLLAWISFVVKILLQTLQSIPYFAEISYLLKGQFIVGYMHLVTLGFISAFLISYAFRTGFIKNTFLNTFFSFIFAISIVITEIIFFLHGTLMMSGNYIISPYFNLLMFIFAIPMVISIILLFIGLLKTKVKLN